MTVFVSYAHEDAAKIEVLSKDLDDLAGPVWFDESISGGQLWWAEILRQIRECRLFVLAVSRHSLRSEACLSESAYASALGRPFLAVRLDDADLVNAPYEIRQRQLIDFVVHDVDTMKALAKAVMRAPQPTALPADLPEDPPVPRSYRDRFAQLFGSSLTIEEQVGAFALLKLDVDKGANEAEALELLRVLHDRRDVAWTVREEIATFLARQTPPPPAAAPVIADDRSPTVPTPPKDLPRTMAKFVTDRMPQKAPPPAGTVQPQAATQTDLPRAGWYGDPTGRYQVRYWDGAKWTEHVGRGGQQLVDRLS